MESLRPLGALGVDLDKLEYVLGDTRAELQQKLALLSISDTYSVEFALSIHSYTLDDPGIYKVVNAEMYSPEREQGTGGLSTKLRLCLPYIKYLQTALEHLPEQFLYNGRCLRGVKWVFPNENEHDPVAYFHQGKKVTFYEFKSTSRKMELMYEPRFCGKDGERTIFDIDACKVWRQHDSKKMKTKKKRGSEW